MVYSVKPSEEGGQQNVRTFMNIFGLLYEDEKRMAETFSNIQRTVPVKIQQQEGRVGEKAMEIRVVGTTPEWFDLVQRPMLAGRRLNTNDIESRNNVVVLTDFTARHLLAGEQNLGQHIRIGGSYFEVVGIIASYGSDTGTLQTPDQLIDAYIPLTAMQERYGDITVRRTAGSRIREKVELHQIIIQVNDVSHVETTAAGIESMLGKFHKQEDYRLQVPLALLRQAEATKRTFNIVLGSIAAISLLVGGIGIMNIMLASVTERTREIGIRRAIGAKKIQVVGQFLIETMVLSTTGGLLGIFIGFLIPWLITMISGLPTVITPLSIVLSLAISMAVGIIFGLYPARRAANLDPIEALRHE
jgi:putative ABC transport system permease protein